MKISLVSLGINNESYYNMEHFAEVPLAALQQNSKYLITTFDRYFNFKIINSLLQRKIIASFEL